MRTRTKEEQLFVDYLKKRWTDLQDTRGYMVTKRNDDERAWLELVDRGKKTKIEAKRGLDHIEHVIHRTFRYVMVTAICTFLEETAREFARRAYTSDFEKRFEAKEKAMHLSKTMTSIELLIDVGFDTTSIQGDLKKLGSLIKLRNCVAHTWGKVETGSRGEAIKEAVKVVDSAKVLDGFLCFGDQVIPDAILACENICNAMIDQLLPHAKIRSALLNSQQ
jgi:hypothetical protein